MTKKSLNGLVTEICKAKGSYKGSYICSVHLHPYQDKEPTKAIVERIAESFGGTEVKYVRAEGTSTHCTKQDTKVWK
jgi:hypothetical protein